MRRSILLASIVAVLLGAVLVSRLASDGPPGEEAPPTVTGVGPQEEIVCPPGAVRVEPGQSLQEAASTNLEGTHVCIAAGTHRLPGPITPKTGQSFTGEFGAVIDGSALPAPDDNTMGIFRCHNEDIDDVVIRNLVLRDSSVRAVHALYNFCDRWVIERNDIFGGTYGVHVGHDAVVRWNHIHHNIGDPTNPTPRYRGGCYGSYRGNAGLWEGNEIGPGCGPEQKFVQTAGTVFRDNTVRGNVGDGIWYDADNVGSVIEGNRVRGNGRVGIHYEISGQGIIRNNLVEGHGSAGIFVSSSHEAEVVGNHLRDNGRGVWLLADHNAIAQGRGWDLRDNLVRDNRIEVVSGTAVHVSCAAADPGLCGAYAAQNNRFQGNRYEVPNPTGRWWFWVDSRLTWPEWQGLGQDAGSSLYSR